ncbi:MAG: hypothetical protein ACMXX8_03530 [Candidatus Woesearchaeota archaeon]
MDYKEAEGMANHGNLDYKDNLHLFSPTDQIILNLLYEINGKRYLIDYNLHSENSYGQMKNKKNMKSHISEAEEIMKTTVLSEQEKDIHKTYINNIVNRFN